MAFYIEIDKLSEDDQFALFSYKDENGQKGKIQLDKLLGEIELIEAAPGDGRGNLSVRAGYKILKHWQEGSLPDSTCWAS